MKAIVGMLLWLFASLAQGAQPAQATQEMWLHGLSSIVCWGDSLTTSGYPEQLSKLMGRAVTNRGIGGNTSSQIAARQGGRPIYMTFVGGEIPASGSVRVQTFTVPPMTQYGRQHLEGTIAGVPGVLHRRSDSHYEFIRSEAGRAVKVPVALPFMMDIGQTDFEIAIIWAGRNNYDEPERVLSDVRAMVDFLKPLNKRFVVMPPINSAYRGEQEGGSHYQHFVRIRDGLREAYPNNFLDIWQLLVEDYDPDNPQDVADYRNGIPPSSLRSDPLHLNNEGARRVAQHVRDYLVDFKGY